MRKVFGLMALAVLGIGILALLAAPGADALGAPDRPAVGVPGETVRGGPTVEEYFETQRRLHEWLVAELPAGALVAPIRIRPTPEDLREIERSAPSGPGPVRIGFVKPILPVVEFTAPDPRGISRDGDPFAGGVIRATDDGGFVWAASVGSEGAGGLRVHFANFRLPGDADLYLFNLAGEAFGPYKDRGPDGTGEFWSHSVFGDTAVVLVRHFGPPDPEALGRLSFVIAQIGHIGRGFYQSLQAQEAAFCGNANCIIDASCSNASAVNQAKDAVAEMEWISGAFIYTCTGGLIADTDTGTQIPYFLTANHCLNKDTTAQNLECFFFFRTTACNGSCPSQNPAFRTLGATVKATGRSGDFTLLQLNQTPPSGTILLGWNNSPVAFTNNLDLYRISHPNFGPQVFSHHRVDTSAPTCSGWPRGERIYSRDIEGAIDGGSSGSPVVNGSGQVVGQLSGLCGFNPGDPCDSGANATVDGALAFYFPSVEPFLDPAGGGCTPTQNPEATCNDGQDNDCDGATDCADSNCAGSPACAGCSQKGASCSADSDCCSGRCRGPAGNRTCK